MFDLEQSIKGWLKQFHKHRAFAEGEIREMELHLRDHIEDLMHSGHTEEKSFQKAVKAFGEVKPMAEEAFAIQRKNGSLNTIFFTMLFKNYFKIALRVMIKSPLSTFINLFGLSVATGVCLVVYAFMDWDLKTDQFHEHAEEVFLTTFMVDREGTEEQYGKSPAPLADALRHDFSSVEKVCRVEDRNMVIKNGEKAFHERIRLTDPEFLEMFSFPLKWGDPEALKDLNTIILSENMAIKYFGNENPLGQSLQVVFGDQETRSFTVSGVAKPFPDAHIIAFDFLVNFQNLKAFDPDFDLLSWKNIISGTLIQIKNPDDLKVVKAGMEPYRKVQNKVENDWAISAFDFVSIADLHLASRHIREDISYDATFEGRVTLPVIGIFILLLACLNYINIAIVSAAKRLKEIGLRKVVGASKKRIVVQFLTENVLITFLAGLTGLLLAKSVFLPWFIRVSQKPLQIEVLDYNFWLFLVVALLLTGIISGMYPAFYIARFDAVHIFKGKVRFGKKNRLTKVFLGVQLVLACLGITMAVMFAQNNTYLAERDWGYDQRSALYVRVGDGAIYQQLRAEVDQIPNVLSVSGARHHLGQEVINTVIHLPDRSFEVQEISVGPNYQKTMGLAMKEGHFFFENQQIGDRHVVVNELLIENLRVDKPIGAVIKIDNIPFTIVGVVRNFHYKNFYYENKPAVFTYSDPENYAYLTVKVKEGTELDTYDAIRKSWAALFPLTPFQGGYQEDAWGDFYQDLQMMKTFTRVIAMLFVVLASLGLYGLVTLNVTGRIREFSIRKTLGAGLKNIATQIIRQYMVLCLISILIGIPVSYFLVKANLDLMFPDPRPIGYTGVLIAALLLILVILLVLFVQIRKVLKSNPVEGLKVE